MGNKFNDSDEIYDELRKLEEKIRTAVENFSDSQLIHDKRQIKSLDDLDEGKIYIYMNKKYGKMEEFKVLSTNAKNGWIKVECINSLTNFVRDLPLSDLGLVPYRPSKKWNPTNYVIPKEE